MSNALLKNQHERMSINTTPDGERLKVIRQERISTENFECVLESSKNQLKVINLNAFGLLIESNVEIKNTTVEGSLIVNNVNLGIYKFKLIRSSKNESSGYNTALEIIGEPISVDRITAIVESSELIATQILYYERKLKENLCL